MLACYRYQFLFRSRQISPHFELLRWFRFNADHEHRRGLPHVAVHSEVRSPRGAASGARQVELAVSLAPLPNLVLVPEPDQKVPWFRREPPLFTNLLWRGLDLPYRFRKRTSHAPPPPLQPAAGRGSCTNRGGLPSNDKATLRLEQARETPGQWG